MAELNWQSYDRRYQGKLGEYFHQVECRFVSELFRDLPEDLTVLDLGAGTGRLVAHYGAGCRRFIAIDLSRIALGFAREKAAGLPGVGLVQADANLIPLKAGSCDLVLAIGLLWNISSPGPILQEIKRIMKPGNLLVFTLFNQEPWCNFWPFNKLDRQAVRFPLEKTRETLKDLGFQVVHEDSTFYMPRWLFWGGYRCLPGSWLKARYLALATAIEAVCRRFETLKFKGFQLNLAVRAIEG